LNQAARRIGRTLALVLPVVLVLSGTLAVASVPWAGSPTEPQVLTASTEKASGKATGRSPQDLLRDKLIAELQQENPGAALTSLQRAVDRKPSLARHCADIARALGRAAVRKYGSVHRAQRYARPVCDASFASGVADFR
jgi:hypothetical protein